MAEQVASGNEFLDLMPIIVQQHQRDVIPESSPKSVAVDPAHKGADPAAGAHGSVS